MFGIRKGLAPEATSCCVSLKTASLRTLEAAPEVPPSLWKSAWNWVSAFRCRVDGFSAEE